MIKTAQPRRPRAQLGRVVGVYGPRGAGVSTVIGLVCGASSKVCTVASSEIVHNLNTGQLLVPNADVVFVELHEPLDVLTAITNGHITALSDGALVKVMTDSWPKPPDDADWPQRARLIERHIRMYSIPHHQVMNKWMDPMAACLGLAQAAKLKS